MTRKLWWMILLIPLAMSCSRNDDEFSHVRNECLESQEGSVSEQLRNLDRAALLSNPGEYLRDPEGYLRSRGVDIEAYQQEVATHFSRPWSERRGVEYSDRNTTITLVRSPIDQLTHSISASALTTQRDVLDAEIEIPNLFGFAYQLTEHDWSIFFWEALNFSTVSRTSTIPGAAQLSKALGAPAISLTISDTGGLLAYDFFEDGVHKPLHVALVQMGVLIRDLLDQLGPDHRHLPLVLARLGQHAAPADYRGICWALEQADPSSAR